MPTILDCKTVCIFAYLSRREQSNKRSETRLKTESETAEGRKKAVRFTDFFTDFEKKTDCVAVYNNSRLQAKAEEAMGKDLSQREKSEHKNESDSVDEYSNESSGRDDNCAGNADENDVSTSECISTRHVFFYNQTAKSDTIGGENAEKHGQCL